MIFLQRFGAATLLVSCVLTTPASARSLAYVASSDGLTAAIKVIDVAAGTIDNSFPVEGGGVGPLALSPKGDRLYAATPTGLATIDAATGAVLAFVPDVNAFGLALSSDGTQAYGSGFGSVVVVDLKTSVVTQSIPLPETSGGIPGIAAANGNRIFATIPTANEVAVIDAVRNVVTASLPVRYLPQGLATSPNGRTVYVANYAGVVSVIDAESGERRADIRVMGRPTLIAASPEGALLYAALEDRPGLAVIATAAEQQIGEIALPETATALAVSADGALIYVGRDTSIAGQQDGSVVVIDAVSHLQMGEIPVGGRVRSIVFGPDANAKPVITPPHPAPTPKPPASGTFVYVTNFLSSDVSVIAVETQSVVGTIELPATFFPEAITTSADGTLAYVLGSNGLAVAAIDLKTERIVRLTGGVDTYLSRAIALAPNGGALYIGTYQGLWSFDPETLSPNFTAPDVMNDVYSVAVSGDGARVYAPRFEHHQLSVLDAGTLETIANVPLPEFFPTSVALDPVRPAAYVAVGGGITIVDTDALEVSSSIPGITETVSFSDDGSFAYAASSDLAVSVIDPPSGDRVAVSAGDRTGRGVGRVELAVTPDARFVYMNDDLSDRVFVFDTATRSKLADIEVGAVPSGLAVAKVERPEPPAPAASDGGCALRRDVAAPPWFLLLPLLLFVRRRRESKARTTDRDAA